MGTLGGVTWRGNISCRLRSEQGNRAATSAEYDRRRTPDERTPGYTRNVGDRGLKGIGVDDDLGHMTRRIDVLGREHYRIPTPHSTGNDWTWSAKAPGDGWWGVEQSDTCIIYGRAADILTQLNVNWQVPHLT